MTEINVFDEAIAAAFNFEAVKVCAQCGTPILMRAKEWPAAFKRRLYCSRRCAGLAIRPAFTWEKFDNLIHKTDDCWLWRGAIDKGGYGRVWKDGRKQYVHRLSYERGAAEQLGALDVLHRCDNPICVRPDHLFPGTQADNNYDMFSKGRNRILRGSDNGSAKLTEEDVRQIFEDGRRYRIIAKDYGITASLVSIIKRGLGWMHLGLSR